MSTDGNQPEKAPRESGKLAIGTAAAALLAVVAGSRRRHDARRGEVAAPVLTQDMVNTLGRFAVFAFKLRVTPSQLKYLERLLVGVWEANDRARVAASMEASLYANQCKAALERDPSRRFELQMQAEEWLVNYEVSRPDSPFTLWVIQVSRPWNQPGPASSRSAPPSGRPGTGDMGRALQAQGATALRTQGRTARRTGGNVSAMPAWVQGDAPTAEDFRNMSAAMSRVLVTQYGTPPH
jgi:hypothetical protein